MKKIFLTAICMIGIFVFSVYGTDLEKQNKISNSIIVVSSEFDEYIDDIKKIIPDFNRFGLKFGNDIQLLDTHSKEIGLLHTAEKERKRMEGFNGYINVAVITRDGKIYGIVIGNNEETPRWIEKVRKAGFLKMWNGVTFEKAAKLKVDAVTGATYSSEAIRDEVQSIVSKK